MDRVSARQKGRGAEKIYTRGTLNLCFSEWHLHAVEERGDKMVGVEETGGGAFSSLPAL